jgi:hypothetical protein
MGFHWQNLNNRKADAMFVKRILPFATTWPQSSIRVCLPLILVLVQQPD